MIDNKQFAAQLEVRTKAFAIRIIRLASKLPATPEAKVIRYQLVKSGTSVGANYREANRSVSKADFRNRIAVCEKEASETQYWLEIIMEADMLPPEQVRCDHKECSELLAMFTSIGKKIGKKIRTN